MKTIVTSIVVNILVAIVAVSSTQAQQSLGRATPVSRVSATPSGITIKQEFLAKKVAAIQADIRVAQRCVQNATINLRDVEGEINRVKSTDIINCGRRLIQLQRELAKLGIASSRFAQEAAAEAEIMASIEKQKQMLQSVSELLRGGSGGLLP